MRYLFHLLKFVLIKHLIRETERKREREREKEKERERERKREREREEEEEEEEEEEKEKEKEKVSFVKGFSFFSWLQDQLWKILLQL